MKPYKIINKLIEKYEAHKSKKLANSVNREIARQEREDNTPKYAVKDLYVGKIIYLKDTWYTPKDDIVHWEFVTMKNFAILTENDYSNYHHFSDDSKGAKNCINKFISFKPWQKKEREKKERKKGVE
jgi:hypothetical protein